MAAASRQPEPPEPERAPELPHQNRRSVRQWVRVVGPGVITGAAGDDPAGIGTYAQTGAQSGTGLLWLMLLATPMLQVVQVTAAKLGIVTKKGLSGVLKEHYGFRVALFAAILTALGNVLTMGADIAGIGAGFELIFGVRWQWFVIPVTIGIWYFQVYMDYRVVRKVFLLLSLSLVSYVIAGVLARPHWALVLRDTFIPRFELSMAFISTAVGLLGTTITPYMYYFQAAEVVDENTAIKRLDDTVADTTIGSIFTNLVSYFVILATATTLFAHHISINTAQDAANALVPFAGKAAKYVFAVGMIGAGLLAIPVLAASTASMVGEVAGWRIGLSRSTSRARGFYLALTITLVFGLVITLSGINPMKALFYSQIGNGIIAPVILFMLFRLASRRDILGEHVNSWKQQAWGWLTFGILVASVVLFFWGLATGRA
jgi:NRAMP (natural resistance-associated macrophage protein)-like metal ion transporter